MEPCKDLFKVELNDQIYGIGTVTVCVVKFSLGDLLWLSTLRE